MFLPEKLGVKDIAQIGWSSANLGRMRPIWAQIDRIWARFGQCPKTRATSDAPGEDTKTRPRAASCRGRAAPPWPGASARRSRWLSCPRGRRSRWRRRRSGKTPRDGAATLRGPRVTHSMRSATALGWEAVSQASRSRPSSPDLEKKQSRPSWADFDKKSGRVGPSLVEFDLCRDEVDQMLPFGEARADVGQAWTTIGQIQAELNKI